MLFVNALNSSSFVRFLSRSTVGARDGGGLLAVGTPATAGSAGFQGHLNLYCCSNQGLREWKK